MSDAIQTNDFVVTDVVGLNSGEQGKGLSIASDYNGMSRLTLFVGEQPQPPGGCRGWVLEGSSVEVGEAMLL